MDKVSIFLEANKQNLRVTNVYKLVEKTVNYIDAHFALSDEWKEFDVVQAIWSGCGHDIVTIIGPNHVVYIPHEVLTKPGVVKVNLVGSNLSPDDKLEQRLTTNQIVCVQVKSKALIDGDNTDIDIEPSVIEKFVAEVRDDADRAEEAAEIANEAREEVRTNADAAIQASIEADNDADRAEEAANRAETAKEAIAGDMSFGIDENGDLIYHWTNNVTVDFYLLDGDLYLEEDY